MSRNPKGSVWNSTPEDLRGRKRMSITVSEEERLAIDLVASEHGLSASGAVGKAFVWLCLHPDVAARILRSK